MRALILAGGDVLVTDTLKALCHDAELVVAADSGVRHAAALEVTPDLIVGDFDSATAGDLAAYPEVRREVHPARKDLLDLELALISAKAHGARDFLLVGALGGRLDQTLAALLIAAKMHARSPIALHSGHSAAYPLRTGDSLNLALPAAKTFSVLSLAAVSRLTLEGASYPLDRAELPFGVGLGVSNETTDLPLKVTLHTGSALLLIDLA